MVAFGPDVVYHTPPRRLIRMWAARHRLRAAELEDLMDVLLHVGEGDWGHEARWKGRGKRPESDWEMTQKGLLAYRERLARRQAGLPEELSERERAKRDGDDFRAQAARMKTLQA